MHQLQFQPTKLYRNFHKYHKIYLPTIHLQKSLFDGREKLFHTDLATIATDTLKQVMESEESPASAKVSACRTVLEVCNLLGKHSSGGGGSNKDLSSMSPEELQSVINSLESSKASMAKIVGPDGQTTDIIED